MKIGPLIFLTAILAGTFLGCAYKEYDPAHPREYGDFWSDEDNRRNSAAYPFTNEYREQRRDR
ncbi:MAG: hypothetical protein OEW15_00275 [Nitrospirota bacterium]|nr:hypothetical protein [Nitrospirota bacterium]